MTHAAARDVLDRHAAMTDDRNAVMGDWRDIAAYVLPRASLALGAGKRPEVVDDTAKDANENLAAGVDGLMFGGGTHYETKPRDRRLAEDDAAKAWCAAATRIHNAALKTGRSGFSSERQKALQGCTALGTACLYTADQPGEHLVFQAVPLSQLFIAESHTRRVDTVQRRFTLTARQAAAKFRHGTLPPKVAEAAGEEKRAGTRFEFIHEVMPNPSRSPGKADGGNMAFVSAYVSVDDETVVMAGGYHEQPYQVFRWIGQDESPWGWAPSMNALATIKRVNAMGRTNLKAAHRLVEPSLYVRSGVFKDRIDRRPDSIVQTVVNRGDVEPELKKFPGPDGLPFTVEMEHDRREAVRAAYHYYLLDMPASPQMTATEYLGRVQQMMRRLGPAVGRIEKEAAEPIGRRTFNILWRAGALPPLPGALDGAGPDDFEVNFISPVERARRAAEAESILRTAEATAAVAAVQPGAERNFDGDRAVRRLAESYQAPADILRDADDVAAERRAAAEAAQAQQAAADMQQALDMAGQATGGLKTLGDLARAGR